MYSRGRSGLFNMMQYDCFEIVPHKLAVFTLSLDDITHTQWNEIDSVINQAEKEKAARFRFKRDSKLSRAAHGLKRMALSQMVNGVVKPVEWEFQTEALGKPYVEGDCRPSFNLSHCEGMVACLVGDEGLQVGIDVERVGNNVPFEIEKKVYSELEIEWLNSQAAQYRKTAFIKLWVYKEALIKAIGCGLSQPLTAISFKFDPLRVEYADPLLGDSDAWHFRYWQMGSDSQMVAAWQEKSFMGLE